MNVNLYVIPALPLIARTLLCVRWFRLMATELPEDAQERDVQRSFIFALAGFSFTAIAGLAVLDSVVRIGLQLPTWYVLLSYISFFTTLNLQSYKSSRWHSQLATALVEVGTLSLMLALVAFLFTAKFNFAFQVIASVLTLLPWLIDHIFRLTIDWRYLSALAKRIP